MASFPTPLRHVALVAIVALIAALGLASTALVAHAATLTISPSDDATVRESQPSSNLGGAQTLEADASSRKDALLRFQVTGVGSASVTSATLRLFAVDGSTSGGDIALAGSSWTEGDVNWQNAPAGGTGVGSIGTASPGTWYEVDVTKHVTADGPVSFRISSTSSNGVDYAAKEHTNGNGPRLVIQTGGAGVPDGQAPSTPGNLRSTGVTAQSVSMSWDASTDNVGVVGYNVYRGGSLLTSAGPSTSFQDTTVAAQTSYRYTVRARDAAGNLSGSSNNLDVTTPQGTGGGGASTYDVTRQSGSSYRAQSSSRTFTGSLKSVVESAMYQLDSAGGGTIRFGAGDFDLGGDWFEITDVTDVTFAGAGMGVTIIRNNTGAATDTEPFDATGSDRLTIRDLTVDAGGPARNTSDALDFDGGDDILIERVEVTRARGRGILFDGKDSVSSTGGTALRNVIRDCVITSGVPQDGIQFLASSQGRVEGCRISGVGGDGIRANKSSTSAAQQNKPSNDNVFQGNTITGVGGSAISAHSGNRNTITGNTLRDNGRDGVRIFTSVSGLSCSDNVVTGNTASGNRYGLSIDNSECARTVVGSNNNFAGNSSGQVNDKGTSTVYSSGGGGGGGDSQAPSTPANLAAADVQSGLVRLTWNASTDNVSVTAYEVFRNGSSLATTGSGTGYTDTTVSASTGYAYRVRARDAAGNTSGQGNTVNVTTPAGSGSGSGPITLAPSDDATISESQVSANFGGSQSLEVDASSRKDSLLRFQVAGIGSASVTSATLRLYAIDGSSSGGNLAAMTSAGWDENSVTWQNAPAAGAAVGSLGGVSPGTWYEIDVTQRVTGDGPVSFRMSSTSSNGADYAARGHSTGNAPQLVIVTAP